MKAINSQPELWDEITTRQSYVGSAHKDTQTIFLRWCEGQTVDDAFTQIPAIDCPALQKLPEAQSFFEALKNKIGHVEIGRALIVSLKPGGYITPHIDEGAYADYYERFHFVLYSHKTNLFSCGDDTVEMEMGELWNFNHKNTHWVRNESNMHRVHLIIDAVSKDYRRERNAL